MFQYFRVVVGSGYWARRDRIIVVLKVSQMLVAEFAVMSGDLLAIVRIGAHLHAYYQGFQSTEVFAAVDWKPPVS